MRAIDIANNYEISFVSDKSMTQDQKNVYNSLIDNDYIKKKIAVFLFFNYIILSFLPELLINNIEINYNIVLEYTIDDIIYDIKLKDVLSEKKKYGNC